MTHVLCYWVVTLTLLSCLLGDSLGRLRTVGPQMFHGCSTDSIGGPGPLEHGDWLVQTVSTFLTGGPYISSAHAAGVSDVIGQLRTATGHPVLVTDWRPQPLPQIFLQWQNIGPQLLDQNWAEGENSSWGRQEALCQPMRSKTERQGMSGRKRERERQN